MAKSVRVDDDNYKELREISSETEVSIARIVNRAIREWLEKRKGEKEK